MAAVEAGGINAKEMAFMAALLTGQSVAEAAKTACFSRRTGYRIVARDTFQTAYKAAKAELMGGAIAKLHSAALAFAEALEGVATDPGARPGERVQAAREGFAALFKARDQFDLDERLRVLETLAGAAK